MNVCEISNQARVFGRGLWRYWRYGEPSPESNYLVQKFYAYTDGRSNDLLFRLLEAKRSKENFKSDGFAESLIDPAETSDGSIGEAVATLQRDGVVVLPSRLKEEAIRNLYQLASSCTLNTLTFGSMPGAGKETEVPVKERGTIRGIDPHRPEYSFYEVPRSVLLENRYVQRLLCDSYLFAVAARYLGVFPVVTRPDMWWDTDFLPNGWRPRPFHVDSGCLRWLKIGVNLTDTRVETPHFVYVKGSHRPNRMTRRLIRRLSNRMNLTDKEVREVCPGKIVHITAPAGSITLADTRGIHKGELSQRGFRLILYFGLEGSAFNNTDRPVQLGYVGPELARAMSARPFSYQFFRTTKD